MSEFCEAKSQRFAPPITGMKNPLGRNRMLCRGEFGAAVFEKRRSIRFRRAGTEHFQDRGVKVPARSRGNVRQ